MQIKISFSSDNNIILPIHYNNIVQAFIYNNIDEDLADFLHNEGYTDKRRKFKLFTFSRILTRGRIKERYFNFGKKLELIVSSPLERFCKTIGNSMLQKEKLYLGKNDVKVEQIQILNPLAEKNEMIIETLSPIVAYSTFLRPNGSKYTCYFEPVESDFKRIVSENLVRKYNALYNTDLEFDVGIEIESIGKFKMNLTYYKNFLIRGASGRFLIKGNKDLLQLALDAGLGSKNSQGFGCIKII